MVCKVKILFVCYGNICRSPTAQGIFENLVLKEKLDTNINVDSAGTHALHIGDMPDSRMQKHTLEKNIDISNYRARQVSGNDFEYFNYIIAMDKKNYVNLENICPENYKQKLFLFLPFAPKLKLEEVPDPYYGDEEDFRKVVDLIVTASKCLLDDVKEKYIGYTNL